MFSLYIIAVRKNNLKLICIPDSIRYSKCPGFVAFFIYADSVSDSVSAFNKLDLQVFFAILQYIDVFCLFCVYMLCFWCFANRFLVRFL